MKIGIFGRHPVPQPGFMGVMSLFEAKHFTLLQNDVDLLIPFESEEQYAKLLSSTRIRSLDDLPKFNAGFRIVPVFAGGAFPGHYDAIIYQSYDVRDWERYTKAIRRSCTILTKNFPKFVPGTANAWHPSVENQFKAFDLVACSLLSDVQELQGDPKFWQTYGGKLVYVPRGADPAMLHPGRKVGGRPTIGIEAPPGGSFDAVAHYAPALRILRERIPELRVLALGSPIPEISDEVVPFARFDRVYERFFNEVWILLIMNYGLSSAHVRATVQSLHPDGWTARAIYEVQNVEAQMAGAALFGHPANLIDELLDPGSSGFYYMDYQDPADIAARLQEIIANYPAIRSKARHWARCNFTWHDCIRRWNDAIKAAL